MPSEEIRSDTDEEKFDRLLEAIEYIVTIEDSQFSDKQKLVLISGVVKETIKSPKNLGDNNKSDDE